MYIRGLQSFKEHGGEEQSNTIMQPSSYPPLSVPPHLASWREVEITPVSRPPTDACVIYKADAYTRTSEPTLSLSPKEDNSEERLLLPFPGMPEIPAILPRSSTRHPVPPLSALGFRATRQRNVSAESLFSPFHALKSRSKKEELISADELREFNHWRGFS